MIIKNKSFICLISLASFLIAGCYPKFGRTVQEPSTWTWIGYLEQDETLAVINSADPGECLQGQGNSKILATWRVDPKRLIPSRLELPCSEVSLLSVSDVFQSLSLSEQPSEWKSPLALKEPESGIFLGKASRKIWISGSKSSVQLVVGFYGNRRGSENLHRYHTVVDSAGKLHLVTDEHFGKEVLLEPMPDF